MIGTYAAACLAQSDPLQAFRFFLEQAADRPIVTTVELLLIGGVVYAVLRSLEGTRGARIVRAVLTILAVSFAVVWLIAERFELERINALYPYFILGVFLVSLVAFQTELRRLLVRVGEGGLMSRWLGGSGDVLDPILTAVEKLARRKIGALIAIERHTQAGAIAETGVTLDAVVTAELLETIFWPGSALHDLGVIVREGRLHAAGCQFPLADSDEVDRSMGSRHRAALGMSHESDAVVVVVSEETGKISLAVNGRFRRDLSIDDLKAALADELRVTLAEEEEESTNADTNDDSTSELDDTAVGEAVEEPEDVEESEEEVREPDGAGQAA